MLSQKPDELANQVHGRFGKIAELHHLRPLKIPTFHLYSLSLMPPNPALLRTFSAHTNRVNAARSVLMVDLLSLPLWTAH